MVQGDLADPEAVRPSWSTAAEALGGLDVLVNNAGDYTPHPPAEVTYEQWQAAWRRILDVNLIGAANVTFCALPHLRASGARPDRQRVLPRRLPRRAAVPAYGASKAGLNSFGQSMALALAADGIAVSAVAPGFVETDMVTETLKAPRGAAVRAQSPFNRVARPEEVAAAVLYLASADAEWASGAVLDLNGASYLR